MKKSILIIGGSGDTGGAVARRFQKFGWQTYLFLRSFEKPETQALMALPHVHAYKVDLEDARAVELQMAMLKRDGAIFDEVFHGAGIFLWDTGYPMFKEPQPIEKIRDIVFKSNVTTKETVTSALDAVYGVHSIHERFLGSHAEDFTPDGPERNGKYREEEYVAAMKKVGDIARSRPNSTLLRPGFINTLMARNAFTPEYVGYVVDWSTAPTPEEYAETIFPDEFFVTRH